MRTVSEVAQVIRGSGHRVTRSRLAVLHVLAAADGVLDAPTIYRLGRREHPRLGRVSVYRTLDLLTELGLVRQVHGEGGCRGFARSDRTEGHYLVCQNCGQVSEFPCGGLDQWLDAVARQTGFLVRGHMIQLDGLCPSCRLA